MFLYKQFLSNFFEKFSIVFKKQIHLMFLVTLKIQCVLSAYHLEQTKMKLQSQNQKLPFANVHVCHDISSAQYVSITFLNQNSLLFISKTLS